MTDSLNDRIAQLRQTRVALRKAIEAAYRDPDPGYRQQRVQAAELALRSTEGTWRELQTEHEARADRVELAQLRHQRTQPAAAPVRRSAASIGYTTKVLVPR